MKIATGKELKRFLAEDIPRYPSPAWVSWHLRALRHTGSLDAPSYREHVAWLIEILIVGGGQR
jgi:hypothetical protein